MASANLSRDFVGTIPHVKQARKVASVASRTVFRSNAGIMEEPGESPSLKGRRGNTTQNGASRAQSFVRPFPLRSRKHFVRGKKPEFMQKEEVGSREGDGVDLRLRNRAKIPEPILI